MAPGMWRREWEVFFAFCVGQSTLSLENTVSECVCVCVCLSVCVCVCVLINVRPFICVSVVGICNQ